MFWIWIPKNVSSFTSGICDRKFWRQSKANEILPRLREPLAAARGRRTTPGAGFWVNEFTREGLRAFEPTSLAVNAKTDNDPDFRGPDGATLCHAHQRYLATDSFFPGIGMEAPGSPLAGVGDSSLAVDEVQAFGNGDVFLLDIVVDRIQRHRQL